MSVSPIHAKTQGRALTLLIDMNANVQNNFKEYIVPKVGVKNVAKIKILHFKAQCKN